MYEAIKEIERIQKDKRKILESVYNSNDPDVVYENQKKLHSMSMSITTDIADAVLPALQKDDISSMVWPKTSLHLEMLSFISIPTTSEIREKYKECIEKPVVVDIEGPAPKPGTKIQVKKLALPAFLLILAAQGFSVPILLNVFGLKKWVWVNIINAACMVFEIVKYFDLLPGKKTASNFIKELSSGNKAHPQVHEFENMYARAIRDTLDKNMKSFDEWFDNLIKVMDDEIKKDLGEQED